MVSEYKVLFNDEIWKRGKAYFDAGKVRSLKRIGNRNVADVVGTETYRVDFTVNPISMTCNCPYARDGHRCKHMAAAFIALEQNNKVTKTKESTKTSPIEKNQWYAYIEKSIDRRGDIRDVRLFYSGLKAYFSSLEQSNKQSIKDFNELLQLLEFSKKDKYGWGQHSLISQVVERLATIRISVDKTQRLSLDDKINKAIKKIDNFHFFEGLINHYYIEDDDYLTLITLLNQFNTTSQFIDEALSSMVTHGLAKSSIETFCNAFPDNNAAIEWLTKYYKESEQYEKGIKLLETIIVAVNRSDKDKIFAQTNLLWFYAKADRISSRNDLIPILFRQRGANKLHIFSILKETMSKQEWKSKGKPLLKQWTTGKGDTSYSVFKAVDAGDLCFEKMMMEGYSIDFIVDNFTFLSNYDEGLVFALCSNYLKTQFEKHPQSAKWMLSDLLYQFPKTQNAIHGLKVMIIGLEEEFKNSDMIRIALEECEERLYEK